jgi:heme/copper-type cytochrome/quinol oxidase subunit 2
VVVEVDLVEIPTLMLLVVVVLVVVQDHIIIRLPGQETPHQLHQFRDMLVALVQMVLDLRLVVVAAVVLAVQARQLPNHHQHKEQKVV